MNLANRSRTSFRSNRRAFSKLLGVRRLGVFERLEVRLTMSADSIDGRPYIDLGTSDNVALDQPKVVMQLIQPVDQIVGPETNPFDTFLLDTGANTILAFQSAVNDMNSSPPPYRTDGFFEEIGVGGSSLYDISIPYQIDYAGVSGVRNTIPSGRIISDDTRDLSQFGPFGITGMPAMTERVTTFDFSKLLVTSITDDIGMTTDFSNTIPSYNGARYSIPVDKRVSFNPEGSVISGSPPVWGHLPFLTGQLKQDNLVATGDFLFDTGAQVSILSSAMAFELGLDSNLDGLLDHKDANYARDETISGIGGSESVPVFLIDQFHVPTNEGTDLVWTELQWIILDIVPGIDAIFGFDNMTSGWVEAFFYGTQPGYIMSSQLDFRNWKATGQGTVYVDLNPDNAFVLNPNGPGALVIESGKTTTVAEGGANDSYTIALTTMPTANVRVNLVPTFGGQVTATNALNSNTFIDFTPANWNVPQTVVVRAVNDGDVEGFLRSSIKNIPTSSDPQYQNVGMPRVVVNIIDNDTAGVMILPTDGSTDVVEGGGSDTYQVVLTYAPAQPVTIDFQNRQNQVLAVRTNGGTSLVFTPANWNVPQSVTVTAVDDSLNEGPHKSFISHVITTTDTNYQDAFVLQETVFITDNDQVDTIPPRITDVIVGSSAWNTSFIDLVDGGGVGSGNGLGISLPGANQLNNLSQNGINKIYVKFNENVGASITPAKLSLKGTNNANYMTGATTAYGVDGTNVLTITLPTRVSKDAVVFSILDTLTDVAGNRLDGEWTDGSSSTSGNGSGTGQFNFRMDFLPGDVNNSNNVTAKDVQLAQSFIGKAVTSSNRVYDINGNGAIDNGDLLLINRLMGSVLPSPPAAPSLRADDNKFYTLEPFTVGRPSGSRLMDELMAKRKKLAESNNDSELVGIGLNPVVPDSQKGRLPTDNAFRVCLPIEARSLGNELDTVRSQHIDTFMQNLESAFNTSTGQGVAAGARSPDAIGRSAASSRSLAMQAADLFQSDTLEALIDRLVPDFSKRRRSF